MAASRPNSRPENALFMVCTWPSSTTDEPFGTSLAVSAIDGPDVGGDRAEIAALRRGVDLHHRLDVVLRDHRAGGRALDVGDAAEDRRLRIAGGRDRQRLQRAQRVDLVLRRLHHDRIRHAVVGIEIIGRRDLRAAGEIDHEAVGDVALGQADILRAGAIDIDVEGRIVGRLLDARIGNAGNVADAAQQLVGIGEIRVHIGAANLQVDRRRRAEIQDLADDVGRQEREGHAGKQPRQLLAQRLDIFGRRPVAFLQLDLDVAVLRADHAGIVVGHVDAGDRHADIVGQRLDLAGRDDLADRLLHVGELVGGLLDAGADLGAHMHQDLAGIDRGEEVAAEERHQQERHARRSRGSRSRRAAAAPAPAPADRDSRRGRARTAPRKPRWNRTSGLRDGGGPPS